MPYSEDLVQRVVATIELPMPPDARKMFGGVAFIVQGNMACGVIESDLIVRVPHGGVRNHTCSDPHVQANGHDG